MVPTYRRFVKSTPARTIEALEQLAWTPEVTPYKPLCNGEALLLGRNCESNVAIAHWPHVSISLLRNVDSFAAEEKAT